MRLSDIRFALSEIGKYFNHVVTERHIRSIEKSSERIFNKLHDISLPIVVSYTDDILIEILNNPETKHMRYDGTIVSKWKYKNKPPGLKYSIYTDDRGTVQILAWPTEHPAGLRFSKENSIHADLLIKKLISNYEKLEANGG